MSLTVLALDSSAVSASVAVVRDDALLALRLQNNGLTHSQTLVAMVESMLRDAALSMADIDRVVVTHGPGSFTGLRIGVSAANGLAWGAGIPCVGVSSLETLALGVAHADGFIFAVQDARRAQVYNAVFYAQDGALTRVTQDRVLSVDDLWTQWDDYAHQGSPGSLLETALRAQPDGGESPSTNAESEREGFFFHFDPAKRPLLVGDGALLCYNNRNGRAARLAPTHLRYPLAWAAAVLGKNANPAPDEFCTPVYLRPSSAQVVLFRGEQAPPAIHPTKSYGFRGGPGNPPPHA